MIQNQRIPIGVMLVAGILAIPVAALTATKDVARYDSAAGHVFAKSLEAVDPPTAQVSHDLAIGYQAKCKAPISLGTLKQAINTEESRSAIAILKSQCESGKDCPAPSEKDRQRYLRIVTGLPCDA
jgi:hypothetical protein